MAISGTDILLYVNTGTEEAPIYTVVGSQRNLSRERTRNIIDASSKDSDNESILPGRKSSTLTLDALYVPDNSAYQAMDDAYDSGDFLLAQIYVDGVATHEASVLIESMSEEYPDDDVATISVTLHVDDGWTEVTS